jgi:outer membrane immunogenic protein
MKKLLVAGAALSALLGTPALAADMALKAPPPPAAPPCVWCGWYAGLNVGGAWSNASDPFFGNAATALFFAANEFPTSVSPNAKGVIGGGQIGYNWAASQNIIIGLEADIQGSGLKGTGTVTPGVVGPIPFAPFTTSVEEHSNWFGTIRGRLGVVSTPNLLIYGTGGLAYGQTEASFSTIATGFTLATCPFLFTCTVGNSSTTRAGWTAGGGFEWMFTPHWSIKAEYLYIDLGNQTATAFPTPGGFANPGFTFSATARFRENIARAGVNWHF